jgi:hypothetical protein
MGDTRKTLSIGGHDYDVRVDGDQLVVTRADGQSDLAESVPVDQLGEDARAALTQGNLDDAALTVAVEGIARALADRGA